MNDGQHAPGRWTDARDLGPRGLGWPADRLAGPYDRLPREPEGHVTDRVWELSRMSAGVHVDVVTAARRLQRQRRIALERA